MNDSTPKLVLLPGMDGTGNLFQELIEEVPNSVAIEVVRYPLDRSLSYPELVSLVQARLPVSEPFVLLAESFSTPIAVQCAGHNSDNLKGLILCAGFVSSPMQGWKRFIVFSLASIAFHLKLPNTVATWGLVGSNASALLLATVRTAISSVEPKVLAGRLRATLKCDARRELGKVSVPILYIQATQDKLVSEHCLNEIRKINPKVVVARISGPHLLLQREPQEASRIIMEFIQHND